MRGWIISSEAPTKGWGARVRGQERRRRKRGMGGGGLREDWKRFQKWRGRKGMRGGRSKIDKREEIEK